MPFLFLFLLEEDFLFLAAEAAAALDHGVAGRILKKASGSPSMISTDLESDQIKVFSSPDALQILPDLATKIPLSGH